jgi:hypothetical protein
MIDNEPHLNKRGLKHLNHPCQGTKVRAVLGHCPRTARSHNHATHPYGSPRETQVTACPQREKGGRRSVAEANQHLEYLSLSHRYTSRHVMSVVDLTHEMAKIKDHSTWSANMRADTR